jgi:F420-non-reducing hydrogenase large subunit
MVKTFIVDPVTRLEGHGNLILQLSDDCKKLEEIEFYIPETQMFEKFCEGRLAEHIPRITPRICGICPIPHHLTPVRAIEKAWNIDPPSPAKKLRKLMLYSKIYSSHLLHFYALAAPDFVYGPYSPAEKRNVVSILNDLPDYGVKALKMMDFGQNIIQTIGAKAVHPVTGIPGGMKRRLTEEERDSYLQQADDQLQWMTDTVNLALSVVERYWDLIANYAVVPLHNMAIVKDGVHEVYEGDIVFSDPEGKRTIYKEDQYHELITEHYTKKSYISHTYLKSIGYPNGVYLVGPLAMANCIDSYGTPLADSALKEMRSRVGTKMIHNQLAIHWARVIETVNALENIIKLLKDPEICSDNIKKRDIEPKEGRGIAITEAPRGPLIYDIRTDSQGITKKLNLIVSTNNNLGGINRVIKDASKQIIEQNILSKIKMPEPIIPTPQKAASTKLGSFTDADLNMVEMIIRGYDCCLSCAAHMVVVNKNRTELLRRPLQFTM